MPNVSDLSESKYLKKEDADPSVVVEITGYNKVNMEKEGKPPQYRYVLSLKGISRQLPLNKEGQEKGLTLNKTNGNRITKATGTGDFDGWIGKQIELYHDPDVEFGGDIVGGIRVKSTPPQQSQFTPDNKLAQPAGQPQQQQNSPRTDETGPLPQEPEGNNGYVNPTDDIPFAPCE